MSNYYIYGPNGTQVGPYDKATLISLIKNHTYTPDCYIWCEGMSDWKPFREVFPPKPKPAPSAPPPVPAAPHPAATPPVPGIPAVPGVPANNNSVNKLLKTIKKHLPKIIFGAVGAVLFLSLVIWWFFIRISISNDKELYVYLNEATESYTSYVAKYEGGQPKEFSPGELQDEISDSDSSLGYTMLCICACDCGEAAEYLIESRGKQINKERFLRNALYAGADDVAEVLIDNGAKLTEFVFEDFVQYAYNNADEDNKFFVYDWIRNKYHETHDYSACAEMLFEDLGFKPRKGAKKRVNNILGKMKMLENGEDFAEYVEKHL